MAIVDRVDINLSLRMACRMPSLSTVYLQSLTRVEISIHSMLRYKSETGLLAQYVHTRRKLVPDCQWFSYIIMQVQTQLLVIVVYLF